MPTESLRLAIEIADAADQAAGADAFDVVVRVPPNRSEDWNDVLLSEAMRRTG